MMAEMFAKRTGVCRGMGGSMHLSDYGRGMLGSFGIVGAGIPIAAGAALSALIRGSGQVAVSFFGDGAINEGVFHEAANMAALWKLPVVFVCENNQYALSMPVERSSAVPDLAARASSYDMPGDRVDGNNVVAVLRAAQRAIERARAGEGPTLLECITYRIRGHARFESAHYRDKEELERWKEQDPIMRLRRAILEARVATERELDEMVAEVEREIDSAIQFAEAAEEVGPEDFRAFVTDESSHA
jgi:pyruvate dehydrogenase E1 component alpha subunit